MKKVMKPMKPLHKPSDVSPLKPPTAPETFEPLKPPTANPFEHRPQQAVSSLLPPQTTGDKDA